MPYSSGRVVHDADAHIMETPTLAARPRRPGRPRPHRAAALPRRQRAAPDRRPRGAAARPRRPPSTGCAERHRRDEYRAVEAEEIMLRKNFAATGSFLAEDRPPGPRPARLLEPARVQHVPQPAAARLGARRRPRPRLRRRPRPQPRAWSSSARSTPGCCRPATCRWSTSTGAAAMADEAIDDGRGRAARRVGLPAGPLAEPPRPRPGVGPGAGGRHPGRVPRRRHRRPHRPGLLPQRPARSRPTSTAARRTSARSTTWASPARRRRRWPR